MIRAALLLLLAALAGCAHLEPPTADGKTSVPARLDALLAFTDPALCGATPEHERFLRGMVAGDANVGFRAGGLLVPKELKRAFGPIAVRRHDGWWTVGVPVKGSLYGLPLVEVVHALPEGGDAGDVSYVFAAPIARVEAVLRARGFPAEAGRDVTLGPPDGLEHIMSLGRAPDTGHSILTCGYY